MNPTFESRIDGVPCIIEITHYFKEKPCRWADNPNDFYGYTEVDIRVLDRYGRPAPWLERKLTPPGRDRIKREAEVHMECYVEELATP